MYRLTLLAALLLSPVAFAEYAGELVAFNDAAPQIVGNSIIWAIEPDAGAVAITVSDPVVTIPDGGVKLDIPAEMNMVKVVFTSVKEGNWWLAAGALLMVVVSLLRTSGKKFHEWLPDNNILDKPLIFLYDTKIGGWVLNWLTALAGGIGTAMAAGVTVDMSLWKSVVMVSTSGTALFELWDDLVTWWKNRKPATPAPAPVPAPAPAPAPAAATPAADPAKPADPPKPGA